MVYSFEPDKSTVYMEELQKRQILINAIMSIANIIVVSGVLFVLYKFLLITVGIEKVGIWSLVLATTSVTQIANFGLSGSVVKFVAKFVARGETEKISDLIQTASLSVAASAGFVLLIFYPFANWILEFFIPCQFLTLARSILPHALLALWLMLVTRIFQGGLNGYQRIDLCSLLLMGSAMLHLLLCFIFATFLPLLIICHKSLSQTFFSLPTI